MKSNYRMGVGIFLLNKDKTINLIKNLDYNQRKYQDSETPYFVINNIQLIPNIDLDKSAEYLTNALK